MGNIRAFVAIPVEEPLRSVLREEQERLRAIAPSVWYTPAERLHLLLGYLGEHPPERLWALRAKLDRIASEEPPFVLHVAGLRAWTAKNGTLHGLAVSCGARGRPVTQLATRIREAAVEMGFPPPQFHGATIRIAGAKITGPEAEALQAQVAQAARKSFGRMRVEAFALVESRIRGEAPNLEVTYTPLITFPLRGRQPAGLGPRARQGPPRDRASTRPPRFRRGLGRGGPPRRPSP